MCPGLESWVKPTGVVDPAELLSCCRTSAAALMKTEEEFQEGNESNRHRDAQLKKRWVCGFKGKSLYSLKKDPSLIGLLELTLNRSSWRWEPSIRLQQRRTGIRNKTSHLCTPIWMKQSCVYALLLHHHAVLWKENVFGLAPRPGADSAFAAYVFAPYCER